MKAYECRASQGTIYANNFPKEVKLINAYLVCYDQTNKKTKNVVKIVKSSPNNNKYGLFFSECISKERDTIPRANDRFEEMKDKILYELKAYDVVAALLLTDGGKTARIEILKELDANISARILAEMDAEKAAGILAEMDDNCSLMVKFRLAVQGKFKADFDKSDPKLFQTIKGQIQSNEVEPDIIDALLFKKQIVLQGPPGTGKTYTAKQIARALTGQTDTDKDNENKQWQVVQFHPSYNYEDFVRGIQVGSNGEGVTYTVENRIFAKMCEDAAKEENKSKPYVLIIDEMNRANLPSVLGELIYGLEYRGKEIQTPYAVSPKEDKDSDNNGGGGDTANKPEGEGGSKGLTVPENLFVIGTMNTADRSIGHIDYAIRRRFAFIDVNPNSEVLENRGQKAFNAVADLFNDGKGDGNDEKVVYLNEGYTKEHVQIGHSYFIAKSKEELKLKMEYEVLPILREYVQDGILDDTGKDFPDLKKVDWIIPEKNTNS